MRRASSTSCSRPSPRCKEYDTLVLLASDWRIKTMERILGTEVVGIPLGPSPLRSDMPVDIAATRHGAGQASSRLAEAGRGQRTPGAGAWRRRRSHRQVEAIKEVVSVSIGSSARDHEVEIELLGEQFRIRREGHNGDTRRCRRPLRGARRHGGRVRDGRHRHLSAGGRSQVLLPRRQEAARGHHKSRHRRRLGAQGPGRGLDGRLPDRHVRSGTGRQEGADLLGSRPLGDDRGASECGLRAGLRRPHLRARHPGTDQALGILALDWSGS